MYPVLWRGLIGRRYRSDVYTAAPVPRGMKNFAPFNCITDILTLNSVALARINWRNVLWNGGILSRRGRVWKN